MVCLWIVGGGLNQELEHQLSEAQRRHSSGDAVSAVTLYRAILEKDQQQPDALHHLGVIAMQAGNEVLALSLIEAALAVRSDFALAWYNRALILHGLGRSSEAEQSVRLALETADDLAAGWDLLGLILASHDQVAEAEKCHRCAISAQPTNAHFHGNLATLLLGRGDLRGAYDATRQAQKLSQTWPNMVLGHIYKAMGHPDLAIACFAQTRTLRPDFAEAAASEAMARLQCGDFAKGWPVWEQRPDLQTGLGHIPLWQGQYVDRLLVYEDQGLGDALHFVRYLPWLRTRVGHIIGTVAPHLRSLFAKNFPDIEWVETSDGAPFDARCRLASLPAFAQTRVATIPAQLYLSADNVKRSIWREALDKYPAPHIGFVWAGNRAFRGDKQRSLPLAAAQRLVDRVGAKHLLALQKDTEDVLELPDLGAMLHTFADTAALIMELDLVITVDTAVAHLAGALGRPVFLMLPFDNDWRWLIGREDSPWYPTMRLFRQQQTGDWEGVSDRVATVVQNFIAGNVEVLKPPRFDGLCLTKNPYALPVENG